MLSAIAYPGEYSSLLTHHYYAELGRPRDDPHDRPTTRVLT